MATKRQTSAKKASGKPPAKKTAKKPKKVVATTSADEADEEPVEEAAEGEVLDGSEEELDDEDAELDDVDSELDEKFSAGGLLDEDLEGDELEDGGLGVSEADDDSLESDGPDSTSKALVVSKKSAGLSSRDPLQVYMREVQGHSLLTPEEEKELAVRYAETQDVDAAARLVTANLRLVVKLAYEYRRAYRNMMDLIQEGNMGLMQAVKKFDPYRGVKLSSYAAWWIRAYMLRYILANWRMVKLGTTQAQRKLFFNLNKEKARLTAMGIEPSNVEIARRLEVTEREVEEMDKRMSRSDASLDTPVNETDGRQIARVELMPSIDTAPDVATESAELGNLLREHLTEFRKGLDGKDLIIFDERLVADEPRTLQDLGNQFGVSRERVRQLESRMTGKLREYLSERIGDPINIG